MSEKHTEGPWKVGPMGQYIFGPDTEMVADMENPDGSVCRMRGVGGELPIEANARLIAAAPELLEALESIADEIENCICEVDLVTTDTLLGGFRDQARKAIAKAKGDA